MDAHVFRLLCELLVPLLSGARIEKIQEPYPDHLTISFYKGSQKHNLICRFGRQHPFCFVTRLRPDGMARPSANVMRLRKYLLNHHIQTVVPDIWGRKLWIMVTGSQEEAATWVCIDLVKGASLRFSSEPPVPEESPWPAWPDLHSREKEWSAWPMLTPALRRTLVMLDEAEQKSLLIDLEEGGGSLFLYRGPEGITKVSAWPLPGKLRDNLTESETEDILAGLAQAGQDMVLGGIHSAKAQSQQNMEERRIRRVAKTLAKLDQDEKRLMAMQAREEEGLLLAAHIWEFDKTEKRASIEVNGLEGTREIGLNERLTLQENMERMFHTAKRGKRGLRMLEDRRRQLESELKTGFFPQQGVAGPKGARPRQPARRVETFRSSDGFVILRGRDARGNQELRKGAAGHDIWVHVETGPGAHVLIRREHGGHEVPVATLDEAGQLAAAKSWLKNEGSVSIMYAELRHIKRSKSGPPGKVLIDKLLFTRLVHMEANLEERLKPAP